MLKWTCWLLPSRAAFIALFKAAFPPLLAAHVCAAPEVQPTNEFDWREIPDTAVLRPQSQFVSDRFQWVSSTDSEIRVRFDGPDTTPPTAGKREEFRFVLITPPGGIESASLEYEERVFLKDGERVELDAPPPGAPVASRIIHRQIGEFRGAKLFQIEYKPSVNTSVRRLADVDWIADATLILRIGGSFQPNRSLSPLLSRPLESIVLNPGDIQRCLPPLALNPQAESERLQFWRAPCLKISVREEGWYSIPAGRLLTEWGSDLQVEELGLYSRGALLSPPKSLRAPEDPTHAEDVAESLFVFDSRGAVRTAGKIDAEDRLFFHADTSREAYDPLRVYWLVNKGTSPTTQAAPTVQSGADIRTATLTQLRASIGEDKEFVQGGLQNEKQEFFWVDRAFPQDATESLDFSLPAWAVDPSRDTQGRIVVVFPSASDRSYVPSGALQSKAINLKADGKEIATVLKRGETGFNYLIEFGIPKDIQGPTLSLTYNPPGARSDPPFLDRLELEATRTMIWAGTDCHYHLIPSASDFSRVRLQPDGSGPESLPPPVHAFGRLRNGAWVGLQSDPEEPLGFLTPGPLVEVSFLTGIEGRSVKEIDSFVWPEWFDAPPQTDQIVLSPKVFEGHLAHIGKLNEKNGYHCFWIDLEDIYDLFSGGQFSPFALRNFLSWATCAWPDPQPASILLVGDTSWDAWNRYPEGNQVPNWTPSYHDTQTPDFPSDLWFVTGGPKDAIADWLWGRIPCQTIGHLEGYLAKRYDFEERPRDDWAGRLLWVSDDNAPVEEHIQELFKGTLPQAMRLRHIRIRDFPFVDNFYYGPFLSRIQEEARNDRSPLDYGKISPSCNLAIREALNDGASLFVYYGHSGPNVLAHERALFGGGSLYSDVPHLRNEGKAPFAFLMTCDVGRFDYAQPPMKWSVGLSEELLFHGRGGCLALVASSGKGLPSDHKRLLGGCLDAWFNRGLPTCGEVLWSGKTQCLIPPGKNLSIEMFTLFGDPLFIPPAPGNRFIALPRSLRWNHDGSLQVKVDLPDELDTSQVKCWGLGDDLLEQWNWESVAVSAEGDFELTLPNARDRKYVLLACQWTGEQEPGQSVGVATFGLDLEAAGKPDWRALYGEGTPNLTLGAEDVLLGDYSVREGETLFIEANVHNKGDAPAENVEVRAFDAETDAEVDSFSEYPPANVAFLPPGESTKVRIRWDRWGGTGTFDFNVKVDPQGKIEESDEEDNEAQKTIRVYGKPDLAWGLVRGTTSGAIDFTRGAKTIPVDWVKDPGKADLKQWSPLRTALAEVDRGVLLLVPITNFGESESATCTLQFIYHFEGNAPTMTLPPIKIPPVAPSLDGKIVGRPVPVLILPGMKRIELEIDPENLLDESDMKNNRLTFSPPLRLWDNFPSLVQKRKQPAALRGR